MTEIHIMHVIEHVKRVFYCILLCFIRAPPVFSILERHSSSRLLRSIAWTPSGAVVSREASPCSGSYL